MELKQTKLYLNNRVKLITELSEFRMAIWINGFGLEDAQTGEEILPLIHSFNLDEIEEIDEKLKIKFRIYPDGLTHYEILVDPFKKEFHYSGKWYPVNQYEKVFYK